MSKVLQVALREFLSTVGTKGFVIGVLITPVMLTITFLALALIEFDKPPRIEGELALVDHTGRVADGVRGYLAPEAMVRRRQAERKEIEKAFEDAPAPVRQLAGGSGGTEAAERALEVMLGEVPRIDVALLPGGADVEAEKGPLREGTARDGGRLALVVVHQDAVERDEGSDWYGGYELFVREKLDERIQDVIGDAVRNSIVAARVKARGLDRKEITALTHVERAKGMTVTQEGEREINEVLQFLMPMGFMVLLMVSVMTSGQYLLTTTVEEKANRVVELLLSAVSPMQLMSGKIIGQMCVGFLILALYAGSGLSALGVFGFLGYIDASQVIYLVFFYVIAYFIIGSLMAAIGAAVNEMREAQTMMTPVILIIMLPWLLWFPITRQPDSVFAVLMSFVPPINSFAMLLRVGSTSPPPDWQVWLSILIGVVSVYGALWFAAKVFRVGLLMYGKPPNFATLIRWVKMA